MAKNALKIQKIKLIDQEAIDNLVKSVQEFMGEFRDPEEQCREAVIKCSRNGIALEAVLNDQRVGIVVLIQMPFEQFQPLYHLAYIATKASARGQGVGKKLLEQVIVETNGSVSLHVGVGNQRAIQLYRRMHWKTVYLRMMPEMTIK